MNKPNFEWFALVAMVVCLLMAIFDVSGSRGASIFQGFLGGTMFAIFSFSVVEYVNWRFGHRDAQDSHKT